MNNYTHLNKTLAACLIVVLFCGCTTVRFDVTPTDSVQVPSGLSLEETQDQGLEIVPQSVDSLLQENLAREEAYFEGIWNRNFVNNLLRDHEAADSLKRVLQRFFDLRDSNIIVEQVLCTDLHCAWTPSFVSTPNDSSRFLMLEESFEVANKNPCAFVVPPNLATAASNREELGPTTAIIQARMSKEMNACFSLNHENSIPTIGNTFEATAKYTGIDCHLEHFPLAFSFTNGYSYKKDQIAYCPIDFYDDELDDIMLNNPPHSHSHSAYLKRTSEYLSEVKLYGNNLKAKICYVRQLSTMTAAHCDNELYLYTTFSGIVPITLARYSHYIPVLRIEFTASAIFNRLNSYEVKWNSSMVP